jgi:hypothetical protein
LLDQHIRKRDETHDIGFAAAFEVLRPGEVCGCAFQVTLKCNIDACNPQESGMQRPQAVIKPLHYGVENAAELEMGALIP